MDEHVFLKVPIERLTALIRAELVLQVLEGMGVDSWDGFGECEFPSDHEIDAEVEHFTVTYSAD